MVWFGQTKQQGQDGNSKGRIGKIEQFWKDLVCLTVYVFYRRKLAHTLHMLCKWTDRSVKYFIGSIPMEGPIN